MANYWQRLREAGLDIIDSYKPGAALKGRAGLVLTGGRDVDPARYGEAPHPETDEPNYQRDEVEFSLLDEALQRDLPVLAICRGHQVLNVALGGKLCQHIESGEHRWLDDAESSSRAHTAEIAAPSRLRDWLGGERVIVNSRHHQGVTPELLAPGLRIVALSPDGLVEGMESERHTWVVGVQWHPERSDPQIEGFAAMSARLFQAFGRATQGKGAKLR
jgi:putative glutamine amidotransferase